MATRSLSGLSLDENIKTFTILFAFITNWKALRKCEKTHTQKATSVEALNSSYDCSQDKKGLKDLKIQETQDKNKDTCYKRNKIGKCYRKCYPKHNRVRSTLLRDGTMHVLLKFDEWAFLPITFIITTGVEIRREFHHKLTEIVFFFISIA